VRSFRILRFRVRRFGFSRLGWPIDLIDELFFLGFLRFQRCRRALGGRLPYPRRLRPDGTSPNSSSSSSPANPGSRDIEKSVAFQADIDKSRLHAGKHASNASFVNRAGEGVFIFPFEVNFGELIVLDQRYLGFVRVEERTIPCSWLLRARGTGTDSRSRQAVARVVTAALSLRASPEVE